MPPRSHWNRRRSYAGTRRLNKKKSNKEDATCPLPVPTPVPCSTPEPREDVSQRSIDTDDFEPRPQTYVKAPDRRYGHGHGKTSAKARAVVFKHSHCSSGELSNLCTAALFELLPLSNSGCHDLFRDRIHEFLEDYRYRIDDVSAITDRNGHTFLWHVVDMGDDAAVKILVQFGFARMISNTEPKSAYVLAQKRGYKQIVARLAPHVDWNLRLSEAEVNSERRENSTLLKWTARIWTVRSSLPSPRIRMPSFRSSTPRPKLRSR